jgi:hypothetical protein
MVVSGCNDCSTFGLSFDPTLAYSFLEDCMILLRLVSIGFAKASDSFIKNMLLPMYPAIIAGSPERA